jgi:hypothetical protein
MSPFKTANNSEEQLMKTHLLRRGGVLAAVVASVVLAGSVPASAAAGDGSAYGAKATVTLLGAATVNVGPLVVSNTSGPTTATLASVGVPGILTTGVVNTSAIRDDNSGAVTATASTANVGLPLLSVPLGTVGAQAIEAKCVATQAGIVGTSTFAGASLGSLGAVAVNPAPNTTLQVTVLGASIATITLNEQISNPDGSLTVNALHVHLIGGTLASLGTGDVIVSSATCGPAGLPMPLASGPGMWIAFGLLGAVALPVGTRLVRKRRTVTAA